MVTRSIGAGKWPGGFVGAVAYTSLANPSDRAEPVLAQSLLAIARQGFSDQPSLATGRDKEGRLQVGAIPGT